MAKLIPLGDCVTRGEQRTLEYLQKFLPDDWVVFGNAQVTSGELTREIDAIVVGDRCVWVVDEKGFGGVITGDEHTWILSDGSARERVLSHILHAAKMVKGKLVAADRRLDQIWIEGLVLLSADDVEVLVEDPRISRTVWKLQGCENKFREIIFPQARTLSPSERETVVRLLAGEGVITRFKRRFAQIGSYRILETLALGSLCQTYRAERERTNDVVILKAYDLSGLPEATTREELRRKAERESKALWRLRHTPGVVRLAESFQEVGGYGGELYFFAQDLPSSPSLAARLVDESWSAEDRLFASLRLCEIVQAIHEAGVIHRNLSPSCIYFFRNDRDFQITSFELARLTDASSLPPGEFPTSPYLAPEVTVSLHNARKESDIYSLGIILFEIISIERPFGNRTRLPEDAEPALSCPNYLRLPIPDPKLRDLEALLQLMVAFNPKDRPPNLSDVLIILHELTAAKPEPPTTVGFPSHPLPEGAFLGEFTILKYLGMGGCFHAYRVAKEVEDSQEYVAKVLRYPELLETARREFNALSAMEHPNIIRALEVRARADAPYHLLEIYAPGKLARDLIAAGPTSAAKVAKWAAALVGALAYMETRTPSVYHGDISPRNIIIDSDRDQPYLIDFGLAYLGESGRDGGIVGTAPYRPPERDMPHASWPDSGDVYSLGLVLCELLFGELPYDCSGGQWNKHVLKEQLFQSHGLGSSDFLQALRRAVAPDLMERFANARELQQALAACQELKGTVEPLRQKRGVVPYLEKVLKVYNRGSCNAENRGMDSDFARITYVPTELDTQLLPQILNHRYGLVVLAGNPGDGKTAFLQQLALQLGFSEKALPLHHWLLELDGWTYECVLDGSAADSERELDSDGVLDALFAPLAAAGELPNLAASLRRTQLLAINDGRLLEYIEDRTENGSWVIHHLKRLMLPGEELGALHPEIILADLNRRSLITGEPGETVFERVLTALVEGGWDHEKPAGDPWEACRECRANPSCHVRFNVETLRHPVLWPRVRQRLRTMLQVIHCRGRLHITMRELRSMLAFLFFGDQSCHQVHEELESAWEQERGTEYSNSHFRQRGRLYFNRLFATGTTGGRLFSELSDFDPARVDNPRFDRLVASALKSAPINLESLFEPDGSRFPHQALILSGRIPEERQKAPGHDDIRRRAFFESSGRFWNGSSGDDYWLEMTSFRSMAKWIESLNSFRQGEHMLSEDLCRLICKGISLTDNVPESLLDRYLAVRTSISPKTDLVVVRLFPLEHFCLEWERPEHRATVFGELPTAMLLRFGPQRDPSLEISADLFELLIRFAQGYRLGSAELEGVAAHLELFKNRLLAMPAKEVCLLHPTIGSYKARQELTEGTRRIVLEVLP